MVIILSYPIYYILDNDININQLNNNIMTRLELITIATTMGLTYSFKDNYRHPTDIYFNGINGQKIMLSTTMPKKTIYTTMGRAMKLYGRRQLKMDISHLLNITSDN